jgi:hypothetical protein
VVKRPPNIFRSSAAIRSEEVDSSSEEAEDEANLVVENSVCPFPLFIHMHYLYVHEKSTLVTWSTFDK